MQDNKFKSISLRGWRQFNRVDIDIHPRLTIITGSNGAGKSSILNIFTQHFGISMPYLGVPKRTSKGSYSYDIGIFKEDKAGLGVRDVLYEEYLKIKESMLAPEPTGEFIEFGEISYSNGQSSSIGAYNHSTQMYGLEMKGQQGINGLHISSHRALTHYQPVGNINLQPMKAAQAYNIFNQEIMNRYGGGHTQYSPIYRMKEALIGMAAFGEGNSYLQSDDEVLKIFKGFIEILKNILPYELGFNSISIRIPDVVLETNAGEFILDSSSGGINAIIEIAWQIYLFSKMLEESGESSFVVTIDEPENHLHPSMQREIIPNLLKSFPNAQFIVATHSPFVVSAVEDSSVYVLNYTGKPPSSDGYFGLPDTGSTRRVSSVKLDIIHKGGTAGEILREVLGVPVTTPDWVQKKVDVLLRDFTGRKITNPLLDEMRDRFSQAGFGELYPEALSKLVERSNRQYD